MCEYDEYDIIPLRIITSIFNRNAMKAISAALINALFIRALFIKFGRVNFIFFAVIIYTQLQARYGI